jgi:hypothetical protein
MPIPIATPIATPIPTPTPKISRQSIHVRHIPAKKIC